jgi:CheY-like chemotaxis protein
VRGVLQKGGYMVLEAGAPADAVVTCQQYEGPIHLLLTDVVMPQMSGPELAQRLLVIRPDTRVLYMSGYTGDAIVHYGVLQRGVPFVEKPFTPDSLARKVREVLDAPLDEVVPR